MPADPGDDSPSFVEPRPYGFFGLLRASWRISVANALALTLLFVPLYLFATVLVAPLAGPDPTAGAQLLTGAILGVAFPAATSVVTAIAVAVIFERLAGRPAGLSNGARALSGRWREVIAAAFFAAVVIVVVNLVLQLLLAAPVVALLAFFLLTSIQPLLSGPPIVVHSIVAEGISMREGLSRARALLAGNWGRTLGNAFMLAFLLGFLALVINGLLFDALGSTAARALVNTVIAGLFAPYIVAFLTLLFLDLKDQEEGRASR